MAANFISSSGSSESSSNEDHDMESDSGRVKPWGSKLDFSQWELDSDRLEIHLATMAETPERQLSVTKVLLNSNILETIPVSLFDLKNLAEVDLSNNVLCSIPDAIGTLTNLTHLVLRNNVLTDNDFPKDLSGLAHNLKYLNLSGNNLTSIPPPILQLTGLRDLFIGGNQIEEVPPGIKELSRLRFLYLGGNLLRKLPAEICRLEHLRALTLCNNRLASLPDCICRLKKLRVLHLHSNKLTILPHGLIFLNSLAELSLRDNPLVVRFAREMDFQASSLLELAARVIKIHKLPYTENDLPRSLVSYLQSAQHCVNPSCCGVYFESRFEHVKFVDFCGKYRIPLMQYLCSSGCHDDKPAVSMHEDTYEDSDRLKRVLLG